MRPGRVIWAISLLLVLAPVLLVPAAVTNDGPSHLYNAWVAAELGHGASPRLAEAFSVDRGVGQTLVSATALQWLGPVLGWDLAERVWLGLILVGLLLSLGAYIRRAAPDGTAPLLTPILAAWVPLSLMTAWGFYDFLVGVVVFIHLLIALEDGRRLRIVALLLLLYLAHLFVFAVGVGIVILRSAGRKDLRVFAATALGAGLVLLLLSRGLSPGIEWDVRWGERLTQLAFSNVLYTVSPLAIAAGLAWSLLLVLGAVLGPRDWRAAAGLLLLAGAALAPSWLAGGTFLFGRTHLLALVVLAPLVAGAAGRLPAVPRTALAAVLLVALGATFGAWTRAGRDLERDRRQMTALLDRAGVRDGDAWVASSLPEEELKFHRAPFHAHLADRVALDLRLVAADNHEAPSPAFPVTWTEPWRGVYVYRPAPATLRVTGAAPGDVLLIHGRAERVEGGEPVVAATDRFAVTRLPAAALAGHGSGARPAAADDQGSGAAGRAATADAPHR